MQTRILMMAILITLCMSGSVMAYGNMDNSMRRQAESEFRIAQKQHRSATEKYGPTLDGLPEEERESMCRQIRSALVDNRYQIDRESIFNTPKFEKQIRELERYASELGCPQD